MTGLAEIAALVILLLMVIAEFIHHRRVRRIAQLAFGPTKSPYVWSYIAIPTRVIASGLLTWGFVTLLLVDPKVHNQGELDEKHHRHLILIVDVSPSMFLDDAGPSTESERRKRASEILTSLFQRIPVRQFKLSVIAVYTEARPVLEDSADIEVVRYILEEIPMYHAFKPGKTDLFKGLEMAATMSKTWNPKSTIVVLLTDGDSVPAKGMPRMPASVAKVLVVGVGDEQTGRFIDGHQSRQDVNTLRQVANRLGGMYHNGNQKHVTSQTIAELLQVSKSTDNWQLTRRELALIAVAFGSTLITLLPILLHYFGTSWRPGKKSPKSIET